MTSTSGGEGYELLYKKAHSVEPVGRHIACFVPITDTARMQAESKISCNVGRSWRYVHFNLLYGFIQFRQNLEGDRGLRGFLIVILVHLNKQYFLNTRRYLLTKWKWGFRFSGIWCCVTGYSFNDVSKVRSAFNYEGQLDQDSCKKGNAKLWTHFAINHYSMF